MVRLFEDGWELGFSAWTVNGVSGGVVMTTDPVAAHHGSYGCKISGLDGNVDYDHYGICGKTLPAQQDLYTRVIVEFTQELSTGMLYILQHSAFGGGISHGCLERSADGTYRWLIEDSTDAGVINDFFGPAFTGPIAGRKICLELHTLKSGSAGQVALWVDGVQVINETGIDTGDLPITECRAEAWHIWGNPNAGTIYLDCFVADTAYIGPEGAPPPPGTGTLSVAASKSGSPVGAAVSVGGQSGTTPVSFNLAPGAYTVTAVYAGVTLTQAVTIVADQTTAITFDFTNPGFIAVNAFSDSVPIAASVSADGQSGTTPVTFAFAPGTYSIEATYQGQTLPAQTATLAAGETVTINFHFLPATHQLTIQPAVGGTTSPPPQVLTLSAGSVQPVVPMPDSGYRHIHWFFDGVNQDPWWPAGSTIYITMNADHTVVPVFERATVTLEVTAGANGTVSPLGQVTLLIGHVYAFYADPLPGYMVDHWDLGGASQGSSNPLNLTATDTMDGQVLTAIFTSLPPPQIGMNVAASGSGTVNPAPGSHTFNVGEIVQFTAIPAAGQTFKQWTLDGRIETANPLPLTIEQNMQDKTLTAEFTGPQPPPTLDLPTVGAIILGIGDAALAVYGLAHLAGIV
jgi:hypothetical protein